MHLHLNERLIRGSLLARAPCATCGADTLHKLGRCIHCGSQMQEQEHERWDMWARMRLKRRKKRRGHRRSDGACADTG